MSRTDAERGANPGYRAFLANGFNVTRALVLFVWEVIIEITAALRAARRDVRPARPPGRHLPADARRDVRRRPRPRRLLRAHRHDARPPGRLRDLRELRRGRPPLRARARRHARGAAQARPAVRPHRAGASITRRARTRSWCSPTTARPRARPSSSATGTGSTSSSSARYPGRGSRRGRAATSSRRWSATPPGRRPGASRKSRPKNDVSDRDVVVLGSGNLGLIYLMDADHRLTLEEIDERHPDLIGALRGHPHIGWLLVRSGRAGRGCARPRRRQLPRRGPRRGRRSAGRLLADRPAAPVAHRRLRARGRHHGRQLLRPAARRGLRVRGADQLPRRAGRPADQAVHPPSAAPRGAGRSDRRRRRGP